MSNVGTIFVDTDTKKQYQCTADISISPTLINEQVTKYGVWKNLIGSSAVTEITPKTMVLEDENGNRVVAVLVDQEVDFTATANDIRKGMVAATDDGVTVGEKFIPTYLTSEGIKVIPTGSDFSVILPDYDLYDYTGFQAIVCPYNTSISDSVSCEKVVIDNNLYDALSTDSIQSIYINSENKSIDLGIKNTSGLPYLIRYFTYKEVY